MPSRVRRSPKETAYELRNELVHLLSKRPVCGYYSGQSPASEPTAFTALALMAEGRQHAAVKAAEWLRELQQDDGSLGVRGEAPEPRWPTSLAALTWQNLLPHLDAQAYRDALARAVNWIVTAKGTVMERPEGDTEWPFGHNTTLVAWPWVLGTHSWIEPTCLHVVALRATGNNDHPRTREAVRLLYDRQLPAGGCNYGNTSVLGQMLRPHVQPSGMLAVALAAEPDARHRLAPTLDFLNVRLPTVASSASLAWAIMGLQAHQLQPAKADQLLRQAYQRERGRTPSSPYRLALLSLAAMGSRSPLFGSKAEQLDHEIKSAE